MLIIKKIKSFLKQKFENLNNEKLKKNILNALPFWVGAFSVGVVAVIYAKLFFWAELGTKYVYNNASWIFFLMTPLLFLLAWVITNKYAPFARGSGIPQVSAAIELSTPGHSHKVNSLLSIKIIVVKIVSSIIMVFAGGVVGREGPTIQIAASVFKKINDWLPGWYPKISKRNMIVTGAAAGLAAAFNTPLGGIVFAIEELTKTHISFFKSALLTGVIIAGLTALFLLGPYLYLGYPLLDNLPFSIIFIVVVLAIITGLAGSLMGQIILYINKRKAKFKSKFQQILYIVLCGLLIATIGFFLSDKVFGSGKEIMVTTLFSNEKHLEWYVPIIRFLGPIISFTVGAAGGIFAPSLSAGASFGAVIAGLAHLTASETNLLILCGMTGFLTSITRSPFTSSILVLEMTNSHNVIFYIMLTALLSNVIANIITKHSFYDYLKHQYIEDIHKANQL